MSQEREPLVQRALAAAADLARTYLDGLDERPVGAREDGASIHHRLAGPMPDAGREPVAVIRELAAAVDPGLVASGGPRYFGFVIGGQLPAAAGADWLTTAWNQKPHSTRCRQGRRASSRSRASGCSNCSPFPARRASASRPARDSATPWASPRRATPSWRVPVGTWRRAACTERPRSTSSSVQRHTP